MPELCTRNVVEIIWNGDALNALLVSTKMQLRSKLAVAAYGSCVALEFALPAFRQIPLSNAFARIGYLIVVDTTAIKHMPT
jgi:hypothetical protein